MLLAADVFGNEIHRARPVERDARDDVLDRAGLQLLHEGFHAGGFELENALAAAPADHVHDRRIVVVDVPDIQAFRSALRLIAAVDQLFGILYDGEGPKAQEIHLEKPELLERRHCVLRRDGTVLGAGERHIFDDRQAGNDHAGRVHRRISRQPLKALRHVDEVVYLLVLIVLLFEVRVHREGLVERDVELLRDHLRDRVRLVVGEIQHAGDVADDAPRGHRAEGDDLDDAVAAVFADDVVDHLLPTLEPEVHVDIGHRDALRVQEAFEDQAVFHRVEIGDPERVGDDRAGGRAAAGSDRDAVVAGEFHVIPDDEEIIDEAHAPDRVELVGKARAVFVRHVPVAALKPLLAEHGEVFEGRVPFRDRVFGELALAEGDGHMAALRDLLCIFHGFRHKAEELLHFLGRFHIILPALVAQAVLVGDLFTGLEAQQDIVGLHVLLVGVVAVVRADERKTFLLMHADELAVHMLLLRDPVVLQLEEEIFLPENVPILVRRLLRRLVVAPGDRLRDLARKAGGETDEAAVILPQDLLVDAGPVIEPVDKARGDDLHEVLVALVGLREEDQVVVALFISAALAAVEAAPRRDIDLTAQDRFDAGRRRLLVEVDAAVHDAVVRDGRGVHPELFHLGDIFLYFVRAVQERVLRVDVKVGKRHFIFLRLW